MYKVLFLSIYASALLSAQGAQPSAPLEALRQNAGQKTQAWDNLAKSLEAKIRAMLPCDPHIASAVEEVRRASDARLVAFAEYFDAAQEQTSARASATAKLLDYQSNQGTAFLEIERAESAEERAGVEGQISQLASSAARRPELADSETALRAVAALTDHRNALMVQQAGRKDAMLDALRAEVTQAQAAEAAIRALRDAHAKEADKWRAYYSARLDRVRAECTAINPEPKPRAAAERPKSDAK